MTIGKLFQNLPNHLLHCYSRKPDLHIHRTNLGLLHFRYYLMLWLMTISNVLEQTFHYNLLVVHLELD